MGLNSPKMEAAIAATHQRLMKMPRWKIKLKLFLIKKGWFGYGFWYRSLRKAAYRFDKDYFKEFAGEECVGDFMESDDYLAGGL